MSKKINIVINPTGGSRVDTEGFKGQSCKHATEAIEQALAEGSGQVTVELKDEWFQSDTNEQHEEVGQSW